MHALSISNYQPANKLSADALIAVGHIGAPSLEVQQMLMRVRTEVVAANKQQAAAVVEFIPARLSFFG